jgi:hypothetical protein
MLAANAFGFWVNLYSSWWSFAAFNVAALTLFVPALMSSAWSDSEKRVLSLWLLFGFWHESISFATGTLRTALYPVGLLIAGVSLFYATRIGSQRP